MPRFFGSVMWFAVQVVAVQVGRACPSKEGGTVCANFAVRQTLLQYSNPVPPDTRLTPISFLMWKCVKPLEEICDLEAFSGSLLKIT